MNKARSSQLWWLLLLILVVLLVSIASWNYSINSGLRPELICGIWYLSDLRSKEDAPVLVEFLPNGVYRGIDQDYACRWHFIDDRLVIRFWKLEDKSAFMRNIEDSEIYSWFAETHRSEYKAEFSDDKQTVLLNGIHGTIQYRLDRTDPRSLPKDSQ